MLEDRSITICSRKSAAKSEAAGVEIKQKVLM